jgi:hypothetical protein
VPLTGVIDHIAGLRVSARQLAVVRLLIGVSAGFAAWEASRMLPRLLGPLVIRLPFFSWLPVLPSSALPLFLAVWLLAAVAFAVGWKTRVAGPLLTLAIGYTLFLDQQTYSNHLYLLLLVVLLLTISGGRVGWPILLLKIQVTIVYFFSAMAKITPQYLAGEILISSLKQEGWLAVPGAWRAPAAMSALAMASIVAELFIAFGLWSRRLRLPAIFAGAGFHLLTVAVLDSSRLSLAIFTLAMFAVYVLFVDAERFDQAPAPNGKA